jgi:hypothetical protein
VKGKGKGGHGISPAPQEEGAEEGDEPQQHGERKPNPSEGKHHGNEGHPPATKENRKKEEKKHGENDGKKEHKKQPQKQAHQQAKMEH